MYFADSAEHAANPPETWTVVKDGNRWAVQDMHGTKDIAYTRTKRDALALLEPHVNSYIVQNYQRQTEQHARIEQHAVETQNIERLHTLAAEMIGLMADVPTTELFDFVGHVTTTYADLIDGVPVLEARDARVPVSTIDVGGLEVALDASGNAVSATFNTAAIIERV